MSNETMVTLQGNVGGDVMLRQAGEQVVANFRIACTPRRFQRKSEEWVDGETIFTLNKRAKAKGGIPLPLLLRILSAACAGLHAAHELREEKSGRLLDLVHRDISPQNIMISSNGIDS